MRAGLVRVERDTKLAERPERGSAAAGGDLRALEDEAAGGVAELLRRDGAGDAPEVVLDQEVPLVGDAEEQGGVDEAPVEGGGGLLEGEVELARARVDDGVGALHVEVGGDVEGGHVGEAAEGEERVRAVEPFLSEEARREVAPGVEGGGEDRRDVGGLEGDVPDGQVEAEALAPGDARGREGPARGDHREVILAAHEFPALARLQEGERIRRRLAAFPRNDVASPGDPQLARTHPASLTPLAPARTGLGWCLEVAASLDPAYDGARP